jgi:hypothetical protein
MDLGSLSAIMSGSSGRSRAWPGICSPENATSAMAPDGLRIMVSLGQDPDRSEGGPDPGLCHMDNEPEAVQHASTATPPIADGPRGLPSVADLPERPRTTSPPRVRIERVAQTDLIWLASWSASGIVRASLCRTIVSESGGSGVRASRHAATVTVP